MNTKQVSGAIRRLKKSQSFNACLAIYLKGLDEGFGIEALTAMRKLKLRYETQPQLLAALQGLLEQATGPAAIYGDGCGRDGTKTGLSHQEFNQLRDDRINQARAAIAKAKGYAQ